MAVFLLECFSGQPAFDKIMGYVQKARDAGAEILIGGTGACNSTLVDSVFIRC
jgi:acyl-CoA reductase-like NAD-dependent aldehyde dehydrogenase